MADLSTITKGGVTYNLKDTTARAEIETLKNSGSSASANTINAIPELRLSGDTTGISKDDKVYLTYVFRDKASGKQCTGWCDLKWQGESSLAYDKKNYKITLYKDPYYENKDKVDFGFGKQSKYTLKGNYQDKTMVRNVVGCRIWGAVVNTRRTYLEALSDTPNNGSTNGFPFNLYLNDEYVGLYTWNTDKSWMTGLDEDNPLHCLVDQDYQTDGFTADAINWWACEIPDAMTDSLKESFQNMLTFVATSTDEEFVANIDNYVDLESAIDYLCFIYLMGALDSNGKNQMMMTWDGLRWYMNIYDQDANLGADWGGNLSVATDVAYPDGYCQTSNTLLSRILNLLPEKVVERYRYLRKTALSVDFIKNAIKLFYDAIPQADVANNSAKWYNSATDGTSNINYYINWITDRAVYVDAQMNGLLEGYVACESIELSAETLHFDGYTSQTIVATVTPENASDAVAWKSSNEAVCTVDSNGVVTAVSSGEAVITAMCGTCSAICNVTVNANAITWSATSTYLATADGTFSEDATGANGHDRFKSSAITLEAGKSYELNVGNSPYYDFILYNKDGNVVEAQENVSITTRGNTAYLSVPEYVGNMSIVLFCHYLNFDASAITVTECEDTVWTYESGRWACIADTGEILTNWKRSKDYPNLTGDAIYYSDNPSWVTMRKIPVSAGQTLNIAVAPNAIILFYKADGTFISGARNPAATEAAYSATAPAETGYAVCFVRNYPISNPDASTITVDGVEFTV